MKRLLFALAIAGTVALLPWTMPTVVRADTPTTVDPAGVSVAPTTTNGPHQYAVGGGFAPCTFARECPGTTEHFAFSLHCDVPVPTLCGRFGQPVSGHVVLWWEDSSGHKVAQIDGPATCLQANPSFATMGFQIEHASGTLSSRVGQFVSFSATDNPPDQTTPDTIAIAPFFDTTNSCIVFVQQNPITSGEISINPGDPLPCLALTDNATYVIDSSCNLYIMENGAWTLMQ